MEHIEWILEAFHGTTQTAADEICASRFRESTASGHWFGNGVYFSVRDPIFAKEYARKTIERLREREAYDGNGWAVLRSTINMDTVFDLTLTWNKELLSEFGQECLKKIPETVKTFKQNQVVRELDALVLNVFRDEFYEPSFRPKHSGVLGICAARNGRVPQRVFPHDGPLYSHGESSSWFDFHDHLQLCVWDQDCIQSTSCYWVGPL